MLSLILISNRLGIFEVEKAKLIQHNNQKENAKCLPHQFGIGDKVMIALAPNYKHGTDRYSGLYIITQVNNNGTVMLSIAGKNNGEILETWNIHQLRPCMD